MWEVWFWRFEDQSGENLTLTLNSVYKYLVGLPQNFLQCKRFPDKNQHVDSGGSSLSGPFLKILLDSFHRSSPSPFSLNFYKSFERMKISGTRKTYRLVEEWNPYVDWWILNQRSPETTWCLHAVIRVHTIIWWIWTTTHGIILMEVKRAFIFSMELKTNTKFHKHKYVFQCSAIVLCHDGLSQLKIAMEHCSHQKIPFST